MTLGPEQLVRGREVNTHSKVQRGRLQEVRSIDLITPTSTTLLWWGRGRTACTKFTRMVDTFASPGELADDSTLWEYSLATGAVFFLPPLQLSTSRWYWMILQTGDRHLLILGAGHGHSSLYTLGWPSAFHQTQCPSLSICRKWKAVDLRSRVTCSNPRRVKWVARPCESCTAVQAALWKHHDSAGGLSRLPFSSTLAILLCHVFFTRDQSYYTVQQATLCNGVSNENRVLLTR